MHRLAVAAPACLAVLLVVAAASGQTRTAQIGCILQSAPPPGHLLRFSPDGRYIVAQDASEVTILSVQPLAVLLRVPAKYAGQAQFSPDSQQVFFLMFAGRAPSAAVGDARRGLLDRSAPAVERWSIASRNRDDSTDVRLQGCPAGELSPDSRSLVCIDSRGTLRVLDVPSGEAVFERAQFGKPFVPQEEIYPRPRGDLSSARIRFSPDGRFVVALPVSARGSAVAFDLREKKVLGLTGELRKLRTDVEDFGMQFTFVGPDRLIMAPHVGAHQTTVTALLVAFPSAEVLSKPKTRPGTLLAATDPRFVLNLPHWSAACYHPDWRAVAVEVSTGEVLAADIPIRDAFGDYYVAERPGGELALYERGRPVAVATIRLDAR